MVRQPLKKMLHYNCLLVLSYVSVLVNEWPKLKIVSMFWLWLLRKRICSKKTNIQKASFEKVFLTSQHICVHLCMFHFDKLGSTWPLLTWSFTSFAQAVRYMVCEGLNASKTLHTCTRIDSLQTSLLDDHISMSIIENNIDIILH